MTKKNSFLIRPINIFIDLLVINTVLYLIDDSNYRILSFIFYINIVWLLISYYTDYYKIYRTTSGLKILTLIFGQFFIFILSFFSFFTLFKEGSTTHSQFLLLSFTLGSLFIVKFSFFYALKIYREYGRNFRRVVIIGDDDASKKLGEFFSTEEDYGYRNLGFFSENSSKSKKHLGKISDSYQYILENKIDEIYCSYSSIDKDVVKKILWFAKSNQIEIKLIPDTKDIHSKNLSVEYYDTIPLLKLRRLPFELEEVRFVKRLFDIIFSLFVCITILVDSIVLDTHKIGVKRLVIFQTRETWVK